MDEVRLGGLSELRAWLISKRIPLHLWGGEAKRVEDLWAEIRVRETLLTDDPPRRHVSFVSLLVRRGTKRLIEVGQLLATGHYRKRHYPPGEKMLPEESAEAAAYRCVAEELAPLGENCRILPGTHPPGHREGRSTSYPGLVTRYRMHQVEMEIPNLPGTAFSTEEHGASPDRTVLRHDWDWL